MRYWWCLLICVLVYKGYSQSTISTKVWEMQIDTAGYIKQLVFKHKKGNDTIPFFRERSKQGPSFYIKREGKLQNPVWTATGSQSFRTEIGGIECELTYLSTEEYPAVQVKLTNRMTVPFQPQKAGLKLGIDTYMDKYPDWFGKYFPTLMRNERTHFYGYMQTPQGHTLALVCEQPIASWSVDYNLGYQDPAPYWFMGHRIEALNLDLLNCLPLPAHHPQHLYELKQGESKSWVIAFLNVGKLSDLEKKITDVMAIPLVDISRTSYTSGEEAEFQVWGLHPEIEIVTDDGIGLPVQTERISPKRTRVNVMLSKPGLYQVNVVAEGKRAEAVLSVHQPWEWVFRKARENVKRYHQKPTSHAESWYGFYSAFLAARYFPAEDEDKPLREYFEMLFQKLHDTVQMQPLFYKSRIQNTSTTIGILVDKYEARKDIRDLERASRLADWLIHFSQREDGAYYNRKTVYTSVIYIAKSILELAIAEQELGREDTNWLKRGERHYQSAKRAIDQLVASQGDFQTEGEMTFEDGMISCSALQIGMLGLLQQKEEDRKHYAEAMLQILNSHNCLTQLRVPDARRRQGTMRYWEAQYDVQMLPNMFNSPHGWSGWRAYATYYAYLLTGEEKWLQQTFNAMGAFANLIDYKTGQLRWAFVVDPYLEVEQACSADKKYDFSDLSFGNPHPYLYDISKFTIGEQYVNMISDWQTVNSQDNDVHEVFKCMGETVLTNAFLIERAEGEYVGYNCRIEKSGKRIEVIPDEKQITHLHINIKKPAVVVFHGKEKATKDVKKGWLF